MATTHGQQHPHDLLAQTGRQQQQAVILQPNRHSAIYLAGAGGNGNNGATFLSNSQHSVPLPLPPPAQHQSQQQQLLLLQHTQNRSGQLLSQVASLQPSTPLSHQQHSHSGVPPPPPVHAYPAGSQLQAQSSQDYGHQASLQNTISTGIKASNDLSHHYPWSGATSATTGAGFSNIGSANGLSAGVTSYRNSLAISTGLAQHAHILPVHHQHHYRHTQTQSYQYQHQNQNSVQDQLQLPQQNLAYPPIQLSNQHMANEAAQNSAICQMNLSYPPTQSAHSVAYTKEQAQQQQHFSILAANNGGTHVYQTASGPIRQTKPQASVRSLLSAAMGTTSYRLATNGTTLNQLPVPPPHLPPGVVASKGNSQCHQQHQLSYQPPRNSIHLLSGEASAPISDGNIGSWTNNSASVGPAQVSSASGSSKPNFGDPNTTSSSSSESSFSFTSAGALLAPPTLTSPASGALHLASVSNTLSSVAVSPVSATLFYTSSNSSAPAPSSLSGHLTRLPGLTCLPAQPKVPAVGPTSRPLSAAFEATAYQKTVPTASSMTAVSRPLILTQSGLTGEFTSATSN
ncbi:unnamed protein product [Protopolystoma xenopodis]|uniref:Uncharacterized protein n=1 Tax=Protopolystoma xenopodis TaxID=117903 RepID=A0A448WLY3_9PLAT|nr:unnamed protein product [Protopolystoma xenopodis]